MRILHHLVNFSRCCFAFASSNRVGSRELEMIEYMFDFVYRSCFSKRTTTAFKSRKVHRKWFNGVAYG